MTQIKSFDPNQTWLDPNAESSASSANDASQAAPTPGQISGQLQNFSPVATATSTDGRGTLDSVGRSGQVHMTTAGAQNFGHQDPVLPDALDAQGKSPVFTPENRRSDKLAVEAHLGASTSVSQVEMFNILDKVAQTNFELASKLHHAATHANIAAKEAEVKDQMAEIKGEQKHETTMLAASILTAALTAGTSLVGSNMSMGMSLKDFFGLSRKSRAPDASKTAEHAAQTKPPEGSSAPHADASDFKDLSIQQMESMGHGHAGNHGTHRGSGRSERTGSETSSQHSDETAVATDRTPGEHETIVNHQATARRETLSEQNVDASRSENSVHHVGTSNNETEEMMIFGSPSPSRDGPVATTSPISSHSPDRTLDESNIRSPNVSRPTDSNEKTMATFERGDKFKGTAAGQMTESDKKSIRQQTIGKMLEVGADPLGKLTTQLFTYNDKMYGGQHEADQAKVDQKIDQVHAQIAQAIQDSAKSNKDQVVEFIKTIMQMMSSGIQRHQDMMNQIGNR